MNLSKKVISLPFSHPFKTAFQLFSKLVRIRPWFILYGLTDHVAGFDNFIEPSNIVYNIPTPGIDRAIEILKSLLHVTVDPNENVKIQAQEMRIKRTRNLDEAVETAVSTWYLGCTLI